MRTINMPAKFDGTDEERAVNLATHCFDREEGRCMDCDSRRGSRSADYPCGTVVPRTTITVTT